MVGSSKKMAGISGRQLNSQARRGSDIRKIREDLDNLNEVIRLTKDSIIRLNDKFGGNTNPPPIYLEEYRELTDKLAELQTRHHNLTDLIEQQEQQTPSSGYSSEASFSENLHAQTLPVEPRMFFPPSGPHHQYVDTEPYQVKHQHNGTNNQTIKPVTVGVIRIFLPNGKTTVAAVKGQSLKSQVLLNTARLKELRDKADQCSVYRFGTNEPVDWEEDSGSLAGMELELRTVNKSFKEMTRILQADHNYTRKTFFALTYCDHCQRILFHGLSCKMCGLKLHQRCVHLAPEFCITKDQIMKISEKIRPPTPSPDSPKTPTEIGTTPIPIPAEDNISYTRGRSSSQPSLNIYKTSTTQDYNDQHSMDTLRSNHGNLLSVPQPRHTPSHHIITHSPLVPHKKNSPNVGKNSPLISKNASPRFDPKFTGKPTLKLNSSSPSLVSQAPVPSSPGRKHSHPYNDPTKSPLQQNKRTKSDSDQG